MPICKRCKKYETHPHSPICILCSMAQEESKIAKIPEQHPFMQERTRRIRRMMLLAAFEKPLLPQR